ncbi:sensor histidine kinase [Altericroceibacterium xinjiangense]|uniref:sensor histidine kinase n=1 Tax=Altericroceibacterium xinjiangense TaxID=762261 RepID=UPI000F7EDF59|nr:HAMP domain-containing sensor histidine kinase [Altericroceibacterium xinjiangense]
MKRGTRSKAAGLGRDLALLAVYAAAFGLSHYVAAWWGGAEFYSLLYPAAGVRLALLWAGGAGWTLPIIAAEVAVQLLTGVIDPASSAALDQLIGVVRAPLTYGLTVGLVQSLVRKGGGEITRPPVPFALAAVGAPLFAALVTIATQLVLPGPAHTPPVGPLVVVAAAFLVGDLLGVLLVTQPLLWIRSAWVGGYPRLAAVPRHPVESLGLFALSWAVSLTLVQAGLGLMLSPVLLATAWIGLRSGTGAAWLAILVSAAIALSATASESETSARLTLHLELASLIIVSYLAASLAEAQRRSQAAIARRDRMLYQAERLKTLRAMSLAVIHEISQPLSTLAIEAKHLATIGRSGKAAPLEVAETAALIERKVATMSDLLRRLRTFGGRTVGNPAPLAVSTLLTDAVSLLKPDVQRQKVVLAVGPLDPEIVILGHEVELLQVMVNLLRNAIAATPQGEIRVTAERDGAGVRIDIANPAADAPDYPGMGIGMLIAREITRKHGGHIVEQGISGSEVIHSLWLPRAERDD